MFTVFQLTYTTLFGWHCSYLFLRTGSFFPPLTAHIFCNFMGVPELPDHLKQHPRRKYGARLLHSEAESPDIDSHSSVILVMYFAGVAAFVCSLGPWTKVSNSMYWHGIPSY